MPRFLDALTNCLRRPGGSVNQPRDLIRELCQANTAGLPKPVLRFLRRGGELAVKIVDGCLQVLEYESLDGQYDVGMLPRFMVDAVNSWKRETARQPVAPMVQPSLRAPYITYDPWKAQISVYFPEQRIEYETGVFWQIRRGKDTERISCQQRHNGDTLELSAVQHILKPTDSTYITVSLRAGSKRLFREWSLEFQGGKGVYLFEPSTQKLITITLLSPQRWWVVYTADTRLRIEPERLLPIREGFSEPEGWPGWRACEIDLESCTALIIENQQDVHRLDVRPNNETIEPRLVGGVHLSGCVIDTPVYIGKPPSIEFPMVTTNKGSDWLIHIKSRPGAQPGCQVGERRLQTIKDAYKVKDEWCILNLAHDNLLGTCPCGMYEIECRTESGNPSSFLLRLAPDVILQKPESILVPDTIGRAPTALYEYSIPENQYLSPIKPDNRVAVHELRTCNGIRSYRLEAAPDVLEVPVGIFSHSGSGTPIVEWVLAIPRLRWQVRSETDGTESWHAERYALSLDELGTLTNPVLVVDLPLLNPNNPVTLVLLDQTNGEMLELSPQGCEGAETFRVFSFSNICAFIREHHDLALRAALRVTLIQHGSSSQIGLFDLSLHPILDSLSIERNSPQDSVVLVQWQPNSMMPARQIRLWNRARPWDSSVTL